MILEIRPENLPPVEEGCEIIDADRPDLVGVKLPGVGCGSEVGWGCGVGLG